MIRIKIVKPNNKYQIGQTIIVSNNEAFGLLDSGLAILSKDMTTNDMKVKHAKPKRMGANKLK